MFFDILSAPNYIIGYMYRLAASDWKKLDFADSA